MNKKKKAFFLLSRALVFSGISDDKVKENILDSSSNLSISSIFREFSDTYILNIVYIYNAKTLRGFDIMWAFT